MAGDVVASVFFRHWVFGYFVIRSPSSSSPMKSCPSTLRWRWTTASADAAPLWSACAWARRSNDSLPNTPSKPKKITW